MLKHLACIMDGNRRWAVEQGLAPFQGHRKGLEAVKMVIDFCLQNQIAYLSLYAFSIENLKRSAQEQSYLFDVLAHELVGYLDEFKQKSINIRFVGDKTLFAKSIKPLCDKIEYETFDCTGLYVTFLLYYGGRQEIVDTVKRIATKVKKGDLQESDITTELFERFSWTGLVPDPDLIIRTGGHRRLSNFLLFQAAYSELYFLDSFWPDISAVDLRKAVDYFYGCHKNFGQ
jgi:undecaprenyl diphosphate synthase